MFLDRINRMDRMLPAGQKSAAADNKPSPAERRHMFPSAQADACYGPLFRSGPTNYHVNPVNPVR